MGYEPEELIGRQMHGLVHAKREDGSDYPAHECPIYVAMKTGTTCRVASEVFWKRDGTPLPVEYSSHPILEGGCVTGAVVTFFDVSERKELQRKALLREQWLNSFFSAATAGLALLDEQLRYVQVNEHLAEMNGLKPAEHVGKKLDEVIPRLAPIIRPVFEGVLATGQPVLNFEFSGETGPQNDLRHWVFSVFPITGEGGKTHGAGTVVVETTELKRRERALRESERKFRELAENIREVFWVTDPQKQQMLYISPAYETVWARSCESLYRSPREWMESVHPEDRARVENAALTKQVSGEYHEKYRITRPDGSIRWIQDRAFPIREANEIARVVGIAEDVTERELLQAQLLRAQRMESIGTLAGGIAHDLNNMLAPILMGIELLREDLQDEKHTGLLDSMSRSAQRGADMVKQVLTFSRGIEGNRTPLQFRYLLKDMENIIRQTFPKPIQFRAKVPSELWAINGDATQIHQVVLNLCVNARDAMPNGGVLTIKAENFTVDEHFATMHLEARPGQYILISVSDSGCGMTAAVRERIFEPFFTTKGFQKGTGLGLSTVQGIVKSHGGFIVVDSELDRGSEFRVFLPAVMHPAARDGRAERSEIVPGNGETILVVDDEPAIRETTKKALEAFNYRVLMAENGAQAVALCAQNLDRVELVLTDLAMPIMDGLATIRAVRTLDPEMKIIAASGFDSAGNQGAPPEANAFLRKPFTVDVLLKTLRTVLDLEKPVCAESKKAA